MVILIGTLVNAGDDFLTETHNRIANCFSLSYTFNHCKKCGKWVSDVMYNADVHECVECAPWQESPNFCPQCGKQLSAPERFCPRCGAKLLYEGGEDND